MTIKDIICKAYPDTIIKIVVGSEPLTHCRASDVYKYKSLLDCEVQEIYLAAIDKNTLCLRIDARHPVTGFLVRKTDFITGELNEED